MFQDKIDGLLLQISEKNVVGEDITFDYVTDQIRNAKKEYDPEEPMGEWQLEPKRADWKLVEKLCVDVLCNRSKDLQVLFWLVESWSMIAGWEGLNDGLDLITKFLERFGADLHPQEAEGRVNITNLFLNTMFGIISKLPLYCDSRVNFLNFAKSNKPSYLDEINATSDKWSAIGAELEKCASDTFYKLEKIISQTNCIANALTPTTEEPQKVIIEATVDNNEGSESNEIPENELTKDAQIPTEVAVQEIIQEHNPTNELELRGINSEEEAFFKILEAKQFLEKFVSQSPIPIILDIALKLQTKTFSDIMKSDNSSEPIISHISKLWNAVDGRTFGPENKFSEPNVMQTPIAVHDFSSGIGGGFNSFGDDNLTHGMTSRKNNGDFGGGGIF